MSVVVVDDYLLRSVLLDDKRVLFRRVVSVAEVYTIDLWHHRLCHRKSACATGVSLAGPWPICFITDIGLICWISKRWRRRNCSMQVISLSSLRVMSLELVADATLVDCGRISRRGR